MAPVRRVAVVQWRIKVSSLPSYVYTAEDYADIPRDLG